MTRATLLTPRAAGGIAVIELHGPAAVSILANIAGVAAPPPPHAIRRGLFAHRGAPIDDGLIVATAADTFEFHIHGGPAVCTALLEALADLGAVIAEPPPTATLEDEVAATLPRALTATGVHLLAHQPAALRAWRSRLLAKQETPHWMLASQIQWLLQRSATLDFLLTPPRVAIIGPPNAGKSTLANALLGRPVSITSDIPGTTRDWIDATTTFTISAGEPTLEVPITLVDTAGIRPTPDPIETESIRRTHAQVHLADAAILVFDATAPRDPAVLASIPPAIPTLMALNKSDLAPAAIDNTAMESLAISALHHQNLAALMAAVLAHLDLAELSVAEPFAFTPRIRTLLRRAALAPTAAEARDLLALL